MWVAWMPDGRNVVIAATERGHAARLYLQDIMGGEPRAISGEGVWLCRRRSPAWCHRTDSWSSQSDRTSSPGSILSQAASHGRYLHWDATSFHWAGARARKSSSRERAPRSSHFPIQDRSREREAPLAERGRPNRCDWCSSGLPGSALARWEALRVLDVAEQRCSLPHRRCQAVIPTLDSIRSEIPALIPRPPETPTHCRW